MLTLTRVFNNITMNDVRFGFNRFSFRGSARFSLNPADFQIGNGISEPIGLPQINVAGAFDFGPRQMPQGRGDTSFVVSDTLALATSAGVAPISVDHNYENTYVQS